MVKLGTYVNLFYLYLVIYWLIYWLILFYSSSLSLPLVSKRVLWHPQLYHTLISNSEFKNASSRSIVLNTRHCDRFAVVMNSLIVLFLNIERSHKLLNCSSRLWFVLRVPCKLPMHVSFDSHQASYTLEAEHKSATANMLQVLHSKSEYLMQGFVRVPSSPDPKLTLCRYQCRLWLTHTCIFKLINTKKKCREIREVILEVTLSIKLPPKRKLQFQLKLRSGFMVIALDSGRERVIWVRALEGDIMLCSWARSLTLTVPLSAQVYKWVLANWKHPHPAIINLVHSYLTC